MQNDLTHMGTKYFQECTKKIGTILQTFYTFKGWNDEIQCNILKNIWSYILTTPGLSNSVNRKKVVTKNEETCCFGNEISKHLHDERWVQSISSSPCVFLHDGLMGFRHNGYHDQVPWAADACETEFG